jgi:transcriptional regulator with XRE-family HTH domain
MERTPTTATTAVPDTASLGGRLSAARTHLGWTREALAFHSGLSWSAIAQIESGRRTNVRPTTLSALCDALGVTVDYLLGRDGTARSMLEHDALLYQTPDEFLETAGTFVAEGVERAEATLAVTTPANVTLLRKALGTDAARVTFVDARSCYTTPTATMGTYRRFVEEKLQGGSGWIRILGEPVWAGRSASEVALWTRYESLLNLEFAGVPVAILCPYSTSTLDDEILEQVCCTHQHTHAQGHLATNPEYREPTDFTLDA